MALCNVKLSAREIIEQEKYAAKYLALIQKELSYRDLVNLDNVAKYTESFKYHSGLAISGYVKVEMPDFFDADAHNMAVK